MDNFTFKLGNSIELLKTLPNQSVDLMITDPPYPTIPGGNSTSNTEVNKPSGILSKNDGKIFKENDIHINNWIYEVYRVMKNQTHIYIMTNFLNLHEYMTSVLEANFKIHNLLIWEKNNVTPNRWYMKNCEYIIFARKGDAKPISNCGTKTIIKAKNVKDKIHPTEKPVELLQTLIQNSSLVGDIVLDPFAGSCSTGIASLSLHRQPWLFEIDPEYYNAGVQRLNDYTPPEEIPVDTITKLTPKQILILEVLKKEPNKEYSGKELAAITGLSPRTCSGCITPLCNAKMAIKTNESSPYKIKYVIPTLN